MTLDESIATLSVSGDLDLASRPLLIAAIDEALDHAAARGLVIDLAATTFLDCAGIGALVHGRNLATERGLCYEIRNATGLPFKLLKLTGVLDPPSCSPTEDPAHIRPS